MNFRRYVGALIIILAFFHAVNQQQSAVPNQEIVLQFDNPEVNAKIAKSTLETVKLKLEAIGAEFIQVHKLSNGAYKIAYFSTAEVSHIKENFAQEDCVKIDYKSFSSENSASFPNKEDNKLGYDLDVYEIQESQIIGWDFDGVLGSKIEAKSDRFLVRDLHGHSNFPEIKQSNAFAKVSYAYYKELALAIDDIPYKIPEVRAGPASS